MAVSAAATEPSASGSKRFVCGSTRPQTRPSGQFYAVLAPLLAPTTDWADMGAQLGRIEEQPKQQAAKLQALEGLVRRGGKVTDPTAGFFRDLVMFLAGMLVWISVAVFAGGVREPGYLLLLCAAVIGAFMMVAYMWSAPRVQEVWERRNR